MTDGACRGRSCSYAGLFGILPHRPQSFSFDVAIFDEAHKTASAKDSYFNLALHDSDIQCSKRVFITATPKHFHLKKNQQQEEKQAFSMDDVSTYGEIAHTFSFREAINKGIVCDYNIVVATADARLLSPDELHRGKVNVNGKSYLNKEVLKRDALMKGINLSGAKKIICYHGSIKEAKLFADLLNESPGLKDWHISHINGNMNTKEKLTLLDNFKRSPQSILTNAKCLTEGVDVPSIDMVAFMSSKKSKVDIVQSIGRAIRPAPGKNKGYIFVPGFLEIGDQDAVEDFQCLYEVINSLKESDGALKEALSTTLSGDFSVQTGREPLEKFIHYIPLSNNTYTKNLRSLCVAVASKVVESWEQKCLSLIDWQKATGVIEPSQGIKSSKKEQALATWLSTQRKACKKGKLSLDKQEKLTELGINLDRDFIEDRWRSNFESLQALQKATGVIEPSQGKKSSKEAQALATWLNTQRQDYKKGKLSLDKQEKLTRIGIDLDRDFHKEMWRANFESLQALQKATGVIEPSQGGNKSSKEAQALATWLRAQRLAYKKGKLSLDKQEKLTRIGINLDRDFHEEMWQSVTYHSY